MKTNFVSDLPEPESLGEQTLLIYDRKLVSAVPGFRRWSKRFGAAYGVQAGEELKAVENFAGHIARIVELSKEFSPQKMTLIAVGGGSVGDFAGFVASVLKRGVRLVQIPSTWLAAIDSAHGGKTALNVGGFKNQIGTFHSAEEVYIVKRLLQGQPTERAREAMGELAKIAVIDGGAWVRKLERKARERDEAILWKCLPHAIRAKYRVVDRDPFEKTGVRHILNLGHTLGHVIESFYRIPHGTAVEHGLLFSLEWSRKEGLLDEKAFQKIQKLLRDSFGVAGIGFRFPMRMPRKEFLAALKQDKKLQNAESVRFVFVRGLGKVQPERVELSRLLQEAHRQGWVA